MKIGEVAKRCGVNTSTIRFYERHGLLNSSRIHRSENGYRDYQQKDIETLTLICKFKDAGLELDEIRDLLSSEDRVCGDLVVAVDSQIEKYKAILNTVQDRIERLRKAKARCSQNCSNDSAVKYCCG